MATLEKAIALAAQAHEGQLDKSGMPYILHPIRVMQSVKSNEAKMIAVLHDVLEDTPVTEEQLRGEGFSDLVIAGVVSVTRQDGESYTDFVIRSSYNELGREVKLADLADNSRLDRALLRADRINKDLNRVRRYLLSYQFLTNQITEDTYRQLMSEKNGAS